jgi:hypothetical protein
MECACCKRPIEPRSAWRGNTDLFFCGSFCADSEIIEVIPVPNAAAQQYSDPDRDPVTQ